MEEALNIDFSGIPQFYGYRDIRPLQGKSSRGGFGSVYIGRKTDLDVDVVIKFSKVIRSGQGLNVQKIQEHETQILKGLKHQYLPRIYDMITVDFDKDGTAADDPGMPRPVGKYVFTVMDYIPGEDLKHYVADNGPVDGRLALRWAKQLCEVVKYLHSQTPPIIHCDIKPANVMITPENNICLIDFNTSFFFNAETNIQAVTHGYAAPEQYVAPEEYAGRQEVPGWNPQRPVGAGDFSGQEYGQFPAGSGYSGAAQRQRRPGSVGLPGSMSSGVTRSASDYGAISKCTDIYAIGATLYYALSGKRPEKSLNPVTPLSSLGVNASPSFVSVIGRAMEKAPSMRFPNADQMLRALDDVEEIDSGLKRLRRIRAAAALVLALIWAAGLFFLGYGILTVRGEGNQQYLAYLSEGDSARDAGLYDKAEELYSEAISQKPGLAGGYISKAYLYYLRGDYSLAADTLNNSVDSGLVDEQRLSQEEKSSFHYLLGNCYYETGEYDKAVIEEKKAVGASPDNAEAWFRLGMAEARAGMADDAEKSLKQLKKAGGSEDQSDIIIAEVMEADEKFDRAHAYFQSAIAASEDEDLLRHAYTDEALLYEQQGKTDSEITLLEDAVTRLSQESTATLRLMLAQARQTRSQDEADDDPDAAKEDSTRALELYRQLAEEGAGDVILSLNMASAEESLDQLQDAADTLKSAAEEYPYDYRVDMRLSYLYAVNHGEIGSDEEDFAEAEKWYSSAEEKYNKALANGGDEDPDMTGLDNIIQQIEDAGYIE